MGTYGENKDMADAFAEWMVRPDGGQKVVGEFAVNGVVLYTKAPWADCVFAAESLDRSLIVGRIFCRILVVAEFATCLNRYLLE